MAKPKKIGTREELALRVVELETEKKQRRNSKLVLTVNNLGINLIRWGAVCVIAFFAYKSIAVMAGQTTLANIGIQFLANVTISEAAAWFLAVCFGTSTAVVVSQKRKAIKHLSSRAKKLELAADTGRSSSNLTETGETNPLDII